MKSINQPLYALISRPLLHWFHSLSPKIGLSRLSHEPIIQSITNNQWREFMSMSEVPFVQISLSHTSASLAPWSLSHLGLSRKISLSLIDFTASLSHLSLSHKSMWLIIGYWLAQSCDERRTEGRGAKRGWGSERGPFWQISNFRQQ